MSTPFLAKQFCTFHVDAVCFGIDVHDVQEVIRPQPMTRVPQAPPAVSGLINLRGQIVTAIDLRCRLGLKPRANSNACMNVVLRDGEGCVSLLVDEIGDVFNVDSSKFEAPPSTTNSKGRDLIVGAYKLPDRLLLVLNTNRVIDEVERHAETKLA